MVSLLAHGRVIRPWLGFHGQLVTSDLKDLLKAPPVGLLVEVIEPGSPAEAAGFRGGSSWRSTAAPWTRRRRSPR